MTTRETEVLETAIRTKPQRHFTLQMPAGTRENHTLRDTISLTNGPLFVLFTQSGQASRIAVNLELEYPAGVIERNAVTPEELIAYIKSDPVQFSDLKELIVYKNGQLFRYTLIP
jgi:hypothetical protein